MKNDHWTDAKLDKLDIKGLLALKTNAGAKSADDLVARCDALLKTKNVRASGPRRGGKPEGERNLATQADERLTCLARKLLGIYDLSETTARAASMGVKGYRYLNLVSKNGQSKLGGEQRNGNLAIDRYISYRIANDRVSLGIILAKEQPVEQHIWCVSGPERLLPGQKPLRDLMPDSPSLSEYKEVGVLFDDFDAATAKFEEMMAAIAPKKFAE